MQLDRQTIRPGADNCLNKEQTLNKVSAPLALSVSLCVIGLISTECLKEHTVIIHSYRERIRVVGARVIGGST